MVFWSKMIKKALSIESPLGFGLKTVKKWLFEGFWPNPPDNPQDSGILVAISILNRAVRTKMRVFWTPPLGLTVFDGVWTGFDEGFAFYREYWWFLTLSGVFFDRVEGSGWEKDRILGFLTWFRERISIFAVYLVFWWFWAPKRWFLSKLLLIRWFLRSNIQSKWRLRRLEVDDYIITSTLVAMPSLLRSE